VDLDHFLELKKSNQEYYKNKDLKIIFKDEIVNKMIMLNTIT